MDGKAASHIQKNRLRPNKQAFARWKLAAMANATYKLEIDNKENGKNNSNSITPHDSVKSSRGLLDHALNDSLTG